MDCLVHFSSVSQMKAAVTNAGNHFFDPGAMRYFHSKIETGIIHGGYFITSESSEEGGRRFFTVRYFVWDSARGVMSGETVGDFQQFATLMGAGIALDNHVAGR